jgi:hypothetical protein
MTHAEKVEFFIKEMQLRGVRSYRAAPPLFRLAWWLGLKVPPPAFLGFWPRMVLAFAYSALFWHLILAWKWEAFSPQSRFVSTFLFLLIAVGGSAVRAWWGCRRDAHFQLRPWHVYPGTASAPPSGLASKAEEPCGVRRDCDPHRGRLLCLLGGVALWCGVLAVVLVVPAFAALPLAITVWVLGQRDLKRMREGAMDPRGRPLVLRAMDWATGAATLCSLGLVVYGLPLMEAAISFRP